MIAASVTVDDMMAMTCTKEHIEDYVQAQLSRMLSQEMMKHATIKQQHNMSNNSTTYVATVSSIGSSVTTTSGYNGVGGTFTNNRVSGIITKEPEFRVMEFTKNGKVTRVELQYYNGDDWHKVPRIQIEEE